MKLRCILRVLAIGTCLLTGLSPSPSPALESLVVRPGLVLVDPERRRGELDALPREERARLCAHDHRVPFPAPRQTLQARAGYGSDAGARPMIYAVMTRAAAWLGTGDRRAAEVAVAGLHRWAQAGALGDLQITPDGRNTKSIYALKKILMGVVPSWAILADYAAEQPGRKRVIDAWLAALVKAANVPTGGLRSRLEPLRCEANPGFPGTAPSNCNNHRYLRDAVAMAWGAYAGDDALFFQGIERFWTALEQMREDGSLPYETQRGARGLWYQRHAVASLTAIAEMAAVQGIDLYRQQIDGRNLGLAIGFLAEEIAHPDRAIGYARPNVIPGPNRDWQRPDLGFLKERAGRHYMAFAEQARRAGIVAGLAERFGSARPLIDELSGGNTTCLSAIL